MRYAALVLALCLTQGCQSSGWDPRYGNVGTTIPPPGTGSYGTTAGVSRPAPAANPNYYNPGARQSSTGGDASSPDDGGWRSPARGGDTGLANRTVPASYAVDDAAGSMRMADMNSRWPQSARFRGMRVNDATDSSEPGRFAPAADARDVSGTAPLVVDMTGAQSDPAKSGATSAFVPVNAPPAPAGSSGSASGLLFRPPSVGRTSSP